VLPAVSRPHAFTIAEIPAALLNPTTPSLRPGLAIELALAGAGRRRVAGVDEVGRGALAGPLVAAAVILPPIVDAATERRVAAALGGIDDSKRLTAGQRLRLLISVRTVALAIGLAVVPEAVVDALGVGPANRLALWQALAALAPAADYALLDAVMLPGLACDQAALIGGDGRSLSIAAASIVAKVTRDRLLEDQATRYPAYGFERHKGYGTAEHLAALAAHGPCPLHRRSFAPLRGLVAGLLGAGGG
jgi:ribonuclease HII